MVPTAHLLLLHTFRLLASVKLAIVLLLILAAAVFWGMVIESRYGGACARWTVYASPWFLGLLSLLGANSIGGVAIRFPWRRPVAGIVMTHVGLCLLAIGSVRTILEGVEGTISLTEGESTGHVVLADGSRITAAWAGRPREGVCEFTFDPGPWDWPAEKTLDVGAVAGISARILRYHPSARLFPEWVPDPSHQAGPAVKLRITGQDGVRVAEEWLADGERGGALLVGPLKLQLDRAAMDLMAADFLRPPTDGLGEKGLLAVYCQDTAHRISVDESLGRTVTLSDRGVGIELAGYFPNAVPDRLGRFSSRGDVAKNPLLELQVHVPGESRPQRQIAAAREPRLSLDGIYAQVCPVSFRYFHPAVKPSPAFELLQTPDGKLHGRVCTSAGSVPQEDLKEGDRIQLPGGFEATLVDYLPHARAALRCEPVGHAPDDPDQPVSEPVALVEVTSGGVVQSAWLRRHDPAYGRQMLNLPHGTLLLSYESERAPLNATLTLLAVRSRPDTGDADQAPWASRVRVQDSGHGQPEEHEVGPNQPLRMGHFVLEQSGFEDGGHGRTRSRFTVTSDPGRPLRYGGSLLVCVGVVVMFGTWTGKGRFDTPAGNR